MHDVILTRVGSSVRVTGDHDQVFDHNLPVTIAGVEMNFARGYQWVDVRAGNASFRFVNTHLEAFSSDLALAQAVQMVGQATASDRTTVIVVRLQLRPAARHGQAHRPRAAQGSL